MSPSDNAVIATPFTEATLAVGGADVRYYEGGQGDPLLVLHGDDGLHLDRTHELLAAQGRVIAIEIPGFGRSAGTADASMPELARTVLGIIDALGLERFSLVGTSFGGTLAVWVAAEAAHRIDKLMLISPSAIGPDAIRPPHDSSPDELGAVLFAHPEEHELPPVDPESAERNAGMLKLLDAASNTQFEDLLSGLGVSTMIVFGTEDRLTPPDLGHRYCELVPEAYFALIYDAGHLPEIERPEAVVDIIGDFLQYGPAFVVPRKSSLLLP